MAISQRMWMREQERRRRERERRARRRRNCAITVIALAIIAVVVIVLVSVNKSNKNSETPATNIESAVIDAEAAKNPYTTNIDTEEIKQSFYEDSAFAGNALAQTIGMYGILAQADFYAGVNVDVENVYTVTPDDSTTSVAEQFRSKHFSKIFLSFGETELKKFSASEFKTHYQKFIEKLKEYQPNVRIYLIGIPPISALQEEYGDGTVTIKKIKEYNKLIMSVAVDEELYFIDSVDALGDNKDFLPKGVSADGINLNRAAVIDLLYYIQRKAEIPDSQDLADFDLDEDDEDEDTDEVTVTPAPKPQSAQTPEPAPTINVFKDSVKEKKKGE